METINDRIRKIREEIGMTTEELAARLGVSRSSIEHVESGRNLPNIQFVAKLHQHFPQFSLENILYGQNERADKNEIIDIQKHDSDRQDMENIVQHITAQHSFTPTCPFLDYKVKKLFQADANEELFRKETAIIKSKSPDVEEVRQTIDGLKRGFARLESWLDDMDAKVSIYQMNNHGNRI